MQYPDWRVKIQAGHEGIGSCRGNKSMSCLRNTNTGERMMASRLKHKTAEIKDERERGQNSRPKEVKPT